MDPPTAVRTASETTQYPSPSPNIVGGAGVGRLGEDADRRMRSDWSAGLSA